MMTANGSGSGSELVRRCANEYTQMIEKAYRRQSSVVQNDWNVLWDGALRMFEENSSSSLCGARNNLFMLCRHYIHELLRCVDDDNDACIARSVLRSRVCFEDEEEEKGDNHIEHAVETLQMDTEKKSDDIPLVSLSVYWTNEINRFLVSHTKGSPEEKVSSTQPHQPYFRHDELGAHWTIYDRREGVDINNDNAIERKAMESRFRDFLCVMHPTLQLYDPKTAELLDIHDDMSWMIWPIECKPMLMSVFCQ